MVIVGGGFGGLQAVQKLRRTPTELTLVDRRDFHLFQPPLYQVATGALSPGEIASPLRGVLKRNANATVVMGEVTEIDLEGRRDFRPIDPSTGRAASRWSPTSPVPGHPEVFALGEMARVSDGQGGQIPLPGVAPAAMQQRRYAASVVRARLAAKAAPPPFRYTDKGSLATIGRMKAVGEIKGLRLSGTRACPTRRRRPRSSASGWGRSAATRGSARCRRSTTRARRPCRRGRRCQGVRCSAARAPISTGVSATSASRPMPPRRPAWTTRSASRSAATGRPRRSGRTCRSSSSRSSASPGPSRGEITCAAPSTAR